MDFVHIFIAISTALGAARVPRDNPAWMTTGWHETPAGWALAASNETITRNCRPGSYLVAPAVIHAHHVVRLDGRPVFLFGGAGVATPFYGQPAVPCELLSGGREVSWEVQGHTSFFARVPHWPEVRPAKPWQSLFYEPLQAAAAISLLTIAIFAGVVYGFWRKLVGIFCASAVCMSLYFALSAAMLLQASLSPLAAHRWADVAVWLGIVGVFTLFLSRGLIHRIVYWTNVVFVCVGCAIMAAADTGDMVQVGTMIPFGAGFVAVVQVSCAALRAFWEMPSKRRFAELMSALCFVAAGGNEMLVVLGSAPNSPTCLQIGMTGTILFLAMALHEDFVYLLAERELLKRRIAVGDMALQLSQMENKVHSLQATLDRSRAPS